MHIKGLGPNTKSDKIFPLEHAAVVGVPTVGKTTNLKMPFVGFARKQATKSVPAEKKIRVQDRNTLNSKKESKTSPISRFQQNSGTTLSHSKWIQEQATISYAQRSGTRWENLHCNR